MRDSILIGDTVGGGIGATKVPKSTKVPKLKKATKVPAQEQVPAEAVKPHKIGGINKAIKRSSRDKKERLASIKPKTVDAILRQSTPTPTKVRGGSGTAVPTLLGVADNVIAGIRSKIESLLTVESAIIRVLDDTDKLRSIVTMQALLGSTITHIRGTNTDLQAMLSVLSSTLPDVAADEDTDSLPKLGGTSSRTVAEVLGGVLAAANIYGGKS